MLIDTAQFQLPFLQGIHDMFFQIQPDHLPLIENKIIVVETIIDMSLNYCVTAPKEWVEKNCPCILNSKFIRKPDKNNEVFGRFGCPFKPYTKENLGYWFAGWDEFENWEPKREDKIES